MFFPNRISSIEPNDRVLEVGPGGTPHHRSDIYLEKKYETEDEHAFQRGYTPKLETSKPVFYYDGDKFPFSDKEFDYVICSHVLEHVEDIDSFCSELQRVACRGYIEYPLIYYDYIYNFDVHVTFLKKNGSSIFWMPKNESRLEVFKPIQSFFFQSLDKNYHSLVLELKEYLFEGFEWSDTLKTERTNTLTNLCYSEDFQLLINELTTIKTNQKINRSVMSRIKSRILKVFV
ncbi:MAG: methyltransferase domain-containing protein [Cyclobacteriaceae bacterium]